MGKNPKQPHYFQLTNISLKTIFGVHTSQLKQRPNGRKPFPSFLQHPRERHIRLFLDIPHFGSSVGKIGLGTFQGSEFNLSPRSTYLLKTHCYQ